MADRELDGVGSVAELYEKFERMVVDKHTGDYGARVIAKAFFYSGIVGLVPLIMAALREGEGVHELLTRICHETDSVLKSDELAKVVRNLVLTTAPRQ